MNDNENDEVPMTSRRLFVGAVAGSLVAGAAMAQQPGGVQGAGPARKPRPNYPKPPFKRQKQEWPGLASKMTPPPDHGETSY